MWHIFGLLALVTIACADVSHLGYHYAKPAENARIMLFPHNKPSPAITQMQHIDYSTMLLEDTKSSAGMFPVPPAISEPTRVFLPPLESKEPITADEPAKDLLAPHEKIDEYSMKSQSAGSEETNPFFKEHSSSSKSERKYPKQSIPIAMKMLSMLPTLENTYIPPGKEVTKTPEQKIIIMEEEPEKAMLEKTYKPPSSEAEKHLKAHQENSEKLKEISIAQPAKEPSTFLKPPVNEEIKSFQVPQTDYLPPQSAEKPAEEPLPKIMMKTVPVTSYIPPPAKQEVPLKTLIIEVPENTYLPASQKSSKPAVTPIKEVKLLNYPEKHTAEHEQIILMVQNGYLPAENKEYRPSINVKAQNPFLHHSPTAEKKEYQQSLPLERKVDVQAADAKEHNPFLHHSPVVMPENSNVLRQDKSFMLPEMEDILSMEQPIENVPISIDIPNYAKVLETGDFVGPSAFGSSK